MKSLASLVKAFFNLIQNVTATGENIALQKFAKFNSRKYMLFYKQLFFSSTSVLTNFFMN